MTTDRIELDITAIDDILDSLNDLKNRWVSEKLSPPDRNETEIKGDSIETLNFLVDRYSAFDDVFSELINSTIIYIRKAKEDMIAADEEAGR